LAATLSSTSLIPDNTQPRIRPRGTGGSKLTLPPLATGPLSLRLAAAGGDSTAQFEVASRLAQGNGVTRDSIAAVKWYTRAASAGHARAQYRLAALYERGTGVATDVGRAKVWYTRAAQQGNVKAMHNLAVLYAGQAGGAPNYVNAVQWFERAAEHNLADSQFNVAILYLNGLGVTKDRKTAYKWFALAARQGDQEAARRLKGLTASLSAADRTDAKRMVSSWQARSIQSEANATTAWKPNAPKTTLARKVTSATIQTPFVTAESQTASGSIGPDDITKVQRLLNNLGFNVGTPDGKIGSRTRTAIKSFQTRNGMIPTGIVDHALVTRIEQMTREKAVKLGTL
jgi:localization factor PodJL